MSAVAFVGLAVGIGVVICASTGLCYCCCKRIIKNHEKKEEHHKKLSERNSTTMDSPHKRKKKKKTKTKDTIVEIERTDSVDSNQSDSNNEFRMRELKHSNAGLQQQSVSSHYYSNSKMNGNIEVIVDSPRELSKSSQLNSGLSFSASPSTDDDSTNTTPASPPHIIILNQSGSPPVTPIPSLPVTPQKNPLAISHNPKLRSSQKMPIGKAKGVRSYETLPGLPLPAQNAPFNPLEENARKNLQKEFQQKLKLSRKGSALNIAKLNQESDQDSANDSNSQVDTTQTNSPRASRHTRIADVKKSMSFPTKFPGEAPDTSAEDSFDSGQPMLTHNESNLSVSIPSTRVSSPSKPPAIIQIDSLTSYYNDSVSEITRSTSEDSKTSEIEIKVSPIKLRESTNNNNNNNTRSKLRQPMFHHFDGNEDDSDGVEVISKEDATVQQSANAADILTLPNHTLDLWQQVTKQ